MLSDERQHGAEGDGDERAEQREHAEGLHYRVVAPGHSSRDIRRLGSELRQPPLQNDFDASVRSRPKSLS